MPRLGQQSYTKSAATLNLFAAAEGRQERYSRSSPFSRQFDQVGGLNLSRERQKAGGPPEFLRNCLPLSGLDIMRATEGEIMPADLEFQVRQLCRAVADEKDENRMKMLLDRLLQVLNERELLACLL